MGIFVSSPTRLQILFPWLNGDALSARELRERIWGFLAPHVPQATLATAWPPAIGTAQQVQRLRRDLLRMLDTAVPLSPESPPRLMPQVPLVQFVPSAPWRFPSLRFAVGRAVRNPETSAKRSRQSRAEQRALFGPGQYAVALEGKVHDLVLYVAMQSLTESGAVAIARCAAPRPYAPDQLCGRWMLAYSGEKGRPRLYCSDICRLRKFRHDGDRRPSTRRRKT